MITKRILIGELNRIQNYFGLKKFFYSLTICILFPSNSLVKGFTLIAYQTRNSDRWYREKEKKEKLGILGKIQVIKVLIVRICLLYILLEPHKKNLWHRLKLFLQRGILWRHKKKQQPAKKSRSIWFSGAIAPKSKGYFKK